MMCSKKTIDTCVIAAGGQGTRLQELNKTRPKALTPILNETILSYQIKLLSKSGVKNFHLLLNYQAEEIKSYIEKKFETFSASFYFHIEENALGSGGALVDVYEHLPSSFLYTYCDIYFDFDIGKLVDFHIDREADFTAVCHPNDHPFDSDLIELDEDGRIVSVSGHPHTLETFTGNLVNAAFYVIRRDCLTQFKSGIKRDFSQDMIPKMIGENVCYGYVSHELLKDMGTPDRLDKLLKYHVIQDRAKKKNVIFLDRDGTLNKITKGNYITSPDDLELIEGVGEACRVLRELDYLLVLVTNQPVIARGEATFEELKLIHNRLDWLLAEHGAYLDYKFYCPHHPDRGYDGEIKEFKIKCDCRKPGAEMLHKASRLIDIDIENSWMIGDSLSDIEAGNKFGLNTCILKLAANDYPAQTAQNTLLDFAFFIKKLSHDD